MLYLLILKFVLSNLDDFSLEEFTKAENIRIYERIYFS